MKAEQEVVQLDYVQATALLEENQHDQKADVPCDVITLWGHTCAAGVWCVNE